MYYILMSSQTKSFYMKPHEFYFYAYRDEKHLGRLPKDARLVATEYETKKELTTMLFNAGFQRGYIDGQITLLTDKDSYYYDRCPNEIAYAQYLLTDNTAYLENIIEKEKLVTVCQVNQESVLFPTVQLGTGETAVLTYTDISRMPQELFEKYKAFRIVKMNFNAKCIVNDKFIAE